MMILGVALLQVLFFMVFRSSAQSTGEGMNLVDIIKAFNFDNDNNLDSQLSSVEETKETDSFVKNKPGIVGQSDGKICFKHLPFCIFFSGNMKIVETNNSTTNPLLRFPDKTDRDKVCYSDFAFINCDDTDLFSTKKKMDFSNVKVKDFCAPGKVELDGTIDVGVPVTSAHTIYASFRNAYGRDLGQRKRSLKPCPRWDYCLLRNIDDTLKWNKKCNEKQGLPCQTPVPKGTYSLKDVIVNLPTDPFEDSTLSNGVIFGKIVLYVDNGPLSCAYVSFRRFTHHFKR